MGPIPPFLERELSVASKIPPQEQPQLLVRFGKIHTLLLCQRFNFVTPRAVTEQVEHPSSEPDFYLSNSLSREELDQRQRVVELLSDPFPGINGKGIGIFSEAYEEEGFKKVVIEQEKESHHFSQALYDCFRPGETVFLKGDLKRFVMRRGAFITLSQSDKMIINSYEKELHNYKDWLKEKGIEHLTSYPTKLLKELNTLMLNRQYLSEKERRRSPLSVKFERPDQPFPEGYTFQDYLVEKSVKEIKYQLSLEKLDKSLFYNESFRKTVLVFMTELKKRSSDPLRDFTQHEDIQRWLDNLCHEGEPLHPYLTTILHILNGKIFKGLHETTVTTLTHKLKRLYPSMTPENLMVAVGYFSQVDQPEEKISFIQQGMEKLAPCGAPFPTLTILLKLMAQHKSQCMDRLYQIFGFAPIEEVNLQSVDYLTMVENGALHLNIVALVSFVEGLCQKMHLFCTSTDWAKIFAFPPMKKYDYTDHDISLIKKLKGRYTDLDAGNLILIFMANLWEDQCADEKRENEQKEFMTIKQKGEFIHKIEELTGHPLPGKVFFALLILSSIDSTAFTQLEELSKIKKGWLDKGKKKRKGEEKKDSKLDVINICSKLQKKILISTEEVFVQPTATTLTQSIKDEVLNFVGDLNGVITLTLLEVDENEQ